MVLHLQRRIVIRYILLHWKREYFSPGGSLSGGRFKNNSNLLGRNREIDDIEKQLTALSEEKKAAKERIAEIETAQALLESDREENRKQMEQHALALNTAQIHLQRVQEQKSESENAFASLNTESEEMERQVRDITAGKKEMERKRQEVGEGRSIKEADGGIPEAFRRKNLYGDICCPQCFRSAD